MKESNESKTRNSTRNLVFGIALKLYQLILPFVIRTITINVLGMEYAGLNSLFTSLMHTFNIAELGVGTALVFSMYKPIKEKDSARICALMKLYKIYYRIIGLFILAVGLLLTPFVPNLINGYIPEDINLYILYYLNLGATVLSYWLFAYKNSLFQAHQRNDLASKVTILTNTAQYALQITILFTIKNYYLFVVAILLTQIANNIVTAVLANKYYPEYKAKGSIPKEERNRINSSIKDLFYGQLGLVVTTSVDSIVISAFLGIVPLALYQNYYYIISALIGFFLIFYQSCRASIGTNLITKKEEDNYADYKFVTFLVMGALTFCISCLYNLYQPFIVLWVGQKNKLDEICVVLFCLYFFVYELALVIGTYKDISGKWHADRFRPFATAIVNLVTNIILVNFIGIYGILISTIFAFVVVNIPWLYRRVFIDVFSKEHSKDYLVFIIKKMLALIVTVVICSIVCTVIQIDNNVITLLINLFVCTVLSVSMYIAIHHKTPEYNRAKALASKFMLKIRQKYR